MILSADPNNDSGMRFSEPLLFFYRKYYRCFGWSEMFKAVSTFGSSVLV